MATTTAAPKERQKLTLLDLGFADVELPSNTPLCVQHALRIESLIRTSYPSIECVFDKTKYILTLRDRKNVKRTFNKRYSLVIDQLREPDPNGDRTVKITRIFNLLNVNIDQYNTLQRAGGSIIKIIRMPNELHSQYLFRYIDLDGSIKTKKKEKLWISFKLLTSSGAITALIIGILALV